MAEVAQAWVSLLPSARGFGSKLDSSIKRDVATSGRRAGGVFGAALGGALAAGGVTAGALGIGALIKNSIGLEATFSQTMNSMAAVANVPKAQIKSLSDLALKMGADTVFSANDAADAMLELAKGGISAANIEAGALKGTLTLATAGSLDLATAATIASNAMNTFGLRGKDMNRIAAALAGGANASTASVESLGQALSQVGPGAKNAGLNLNQTVGVLSAFDNAGIKGSDAGTSLKTMLSRLVPQTDKAATAMASLGLKFTDARGQFVPITNVAEQLRKKLGPLSQAQRTTALSTIFGSDATRAATVLMNEGAKGIGKYIKATLDQNAAQRVAKARMAGTAGAIEQLKGSLETVMLRFGQFISPAVQAGLRGLTAGINGIIPTFHRLAGLFDGGGGGGFSRFAESVRTNFIPVMQRLAEFLVNDVLPAGRKLGEYLAVRLTPVFRQIGHILTAQVVPILGRLGVFLYGTVYPAVLRVATVVASRLRPVFDAVVQAVRNDVLPALSGLLGLFQRNQGSIQRVAAVVGRLIGGFIVFNATVLGKVLPPLIRLAGVAFRVGAGGFGVLVVGAARVVGAMARAGASFIRAISAVTRFQIGVARTIGRVVALVNSLPGRIVRALGNLGGLLVNAGRSLIEGLIRGIESRIGALTSKLRNLTGLIARTKGPPKVDRVLLRPAGRMIIDGLISGLDDRTPALTRKLSTTTDVIGGLGFGSPKFAGLAAGVADLSDVGGGTKALTITNWDEGTGYIEDISDTRYYANSSLPA